MTYTSYACALLLAISSCSALAFQVDQHHWYSVGYSFGSELIEFYNAEESGNELRAHALEKRVLTSYAHHIANLKRVELCTVESDVVQLPLLQAMYHAAQGIRDCLTAFSPCAGSRAEAYRNEDLDTTLQIIHQLEKGVYACWHCDTRIDSSEPNTYDEFTNTYAYMPC